MLILVEGKQTEIPVSEMKDGDVAVITHWTNSVVSKKDHYVGTIVQRFYNDLVRLGAPGESCWTGFFDNTTINSGIYRVRLLTSEDTITVANKEIK